MAKLRPRSCIIDGEAVVLGDDGLPSFDRLRYRRRDASVILVAFDLIELGGEDLRRDPIREAPTPFHLKLIAELFGRVPGCGRSAGRLLLFRSCRRPFHVIQRQRHQRFGDGWCSTLNRELCGSVGQPFVVLRVSILFAPFLQSWFDRRGYFGAKCLLAP